MLGLILYRRLKRFFYETIVLRELSGSDREAAQKDPGMRKGEMVGGSYESAFSGYPPQKHSYVL